MQLPKTKAAAKASIIELEKLLGRSLPKSYLNFVEEHDGARPAANIFKVGENNSAEVSEFVSAHESIRIPCAVEGFPKNALAIARASGGNFVYLAPENLAVYFWDHEIEDADIKIAGSFDEFLDNLQPFDASQIKLKPGQVKSAWIDPDFLKSLKK
jgi:hypothetical protein